MSASCTGVVSDFTYNTYDYKCRERLDKWLDAAPQAGEEQIWVGDHYSLAQAKRDVAMELAYQEESAELNCYPQTDW
jgi:hypothetical protein